MPKNKGTNKKPVKTAKNNQPMAASPLFTYNDSEQDKKKKKSKSVGIKSLKVE